MKDKNKRINPRFPGNRRRVLIILLLFFLTLPPLQRLADKYPEPVRPVMLDFYPVGQIRPDSDNGNLNTAHVYLSITNPSSVTRSVTFLITYHLPATDKHFTFDIEHLYVQEDDGTYREQPGTVVEVPGSTSLSIRLTAVDWESSMELSTRGGPDVKIISKDAKKPACEVTEYTTDMRSTAFKDRDEKLTFLARYLKMYSEASDAAYHIVYHDNSKGRVPGPSDFDIRAACIVKPEDMALWTAGMKKIPPEQVNPDWWEDLKTPEFTWDIPGDAEYYKRPGSKSYAVVCPELHLILKAVSTMSLPPPPEQSDFLNKLPEGLSGYDQFKALAADALGYDRTALPYIRTAWAEKTRTSDGTELTLICCRAMFFSSPLYGIPVLAVSGNGRTSCTVLCGGSCDDQWNLADIDGDGQDELLMNHLVSITGGAGAYESGIYRLSDGGISKIFGSPDRETNGHFDTGFTLHLSGGYTHTVENGSVCFSASFTRRDPDGNPCFDEDGNLTDEGREHNVTDFLSADPYFYLFKPVDVDGDGVYEIMTAQYTYLYGRADGLGAAYTLLKWDGGTDGMGHMYVMKAGFWPYEDYGEESEESEESQESGKSQDYSERWEEYENTWYMDQEPEPVHSTDPQAIVKAACKQIRAIDFHVRQYPVKASFYDSAMDKRYREAFYKAVTNQKPVLCRAYRSLDYEERTYRQILRSESLSSQDFLTQELKQDSLYYYTDYDGDGLPELIVQNPGLYGLKYDPGQDQVYLFLSTYSSYSYFMGDGQIFRHNPCLVGKDIYSYDSEDRNGNRVYAGFKTVASLKGDNWSDSYYISTEDYTDVKVSRSLWEELFSLLGNAYKDAPAPESYEEFFKDALNDT